MGNFPNNFLWGAATSSHQVEGNNNLNDWWEWEQEGKASEHSNAACKHYSHFKEDFAIAKELNHNCHRFSLEWSRIEPEEGIINQEAISHYREVIQSLRSLNIEPIVTINHFSLPLWFYKKGGWENPDAPHIFAEFVKRIAREYGDMVSYWITINEPIVYAYQGYIISKWPPGKNDFSLCLRVIRNLILAHVLSYQAIHSQVKDSKVGLAKHAIVYEPCSRISLKDKLSVSLRSYITNHFFIKSIMKGKISLPRFFNEKLPIKRSLDFIGINYYRRDFIRNIGFGLPEILGDICKPSHHKKEIVAINSLDWEIYPKGLYKVLKDFSRYKLPLIVTENGMCTDDDKERVKFLKDHLKELQRAIDEGLDIFGYIHWSLMDNFEWDKGFSPRFGLVGMDYNTQERKIKESALYYARVCKEGRVE